MTNLERAKNIIDLANFRLARWTDRRKHEWTISAGLWVALGGVALSGKIGTVSGRLLAIILAVIVIAHAILWVRFNFTRNQLDLKAAFDYVGEAHSILLKSAAAPAPKDHEIKKWVKNNCPYFEFLVEPPCLFEILLTLILAAFVLFNRHAV